MLKNLVSFLQLTCFELKASHDISLIILLFHSYNVFSESFDESLPFFALASWRTETRLTQEPCWMFFYCKTSRFKTASSNSCSAFEGIIFIHHGWKGARFIQFQIIICAILFHSILSFVFYCYWCVSPIFLMNYKNHQCSSGTGDITVPA